MVERHFSGDGLDATKLVPVPEDQATPPPATSGNPATLEEAMRAAQQSLRLSFSMDPGTIGSRPLTPLEIEMGSVDDNSGDHVGAVMCGEPGVATTASEGEKAGTGSVPSAAAEEEDCADGITATCNDIAIQIDDGSPLAEPPPAVAPSVAVLAAGASVASRGGEEEDAVLRRRRDRVHRGGQHTALPVGTPAVAAVEILKTLPLKLEGLDVTVIGHSEIVGKPIAFLLMGLGATVTVCHHMTRSVAMHSRAADAVFVAVGKPGLVTGDMLKPGAALIDIGINRVDGKTVGTRISTAAPRWRAGSRRCPAGSGR